MMFVSEDVVVGKDYVLLGENFNSCLEDYLDKFPNIKKIIFTDKYVFCNTSESYYNKISEEYTKFSNYKNNSNGAFNNKLKLNNNITHLSLNDKFNRKLVCPENLKYLRLGYYYDKCLKLNENLKTLILGGCFDCPLELNEKIEEIEFRLAYSTKIKLTKNIRKIKIQRNFKEIHFPNKIKDFYCSNNKIKIYNFFPNSIIKLMYYRSFNNKIKNIPNKVVKLYILSTCINNINLLPKKYPFSCKQIVLPILFSKCFSCKKINNCEIKFVEPCFT